MQVTTGIPGLRAANGLIAKLHRLGIRDVEPMYDFQVKRWAICQQFKPSGRILLFNTRAAEAAKPNLLWWCRLTDGGFREPNDQDLQDIIVTVKRAAVVFDKGGDWLVDQVEAAEQQTYQARRRLQSERIRAVAKPLKRAIRKELL